MKLTGVAIGVLRFLGKGLLSFLLAMLLYFVAALIGSVIPVNTDETKKGKITIYLRTNGVHTDFIFPVKSEVVDWNKIIHPEVILSKSTNFSHISFGWGDLKFYRETQEWEDLRFPVAFQAVFLENPSAMHVTYEAAIRFDQPAISLNITKEQYRRLIAYVLDQFEKDPAGNLKPIEDLQYNRHDAFFHGKGSLHFFYTCNTWVNAGLKAAGLRACLWTPFDDGIFYQYL